MASETELMRMGVAALQAGNRQSAVSILTQVVESNPGNEQAWFYLAAAETDLNMRKRYLQKVLELNPKNAKAWEIMEKLIAKEQAPAPNPTSAPPPAPVAEVTPPAPKSFIVDPLPDVETVDSFDPPPPVMSWSASEETVSSWETSNTVDESDDLPDPETFAPISRSTAKRTIPTTPDEPVSEDLFSAFDKSKAAPTDAKVTYKTIRPLAVDAGSLLGAAQGNSGFILPIDIPGAPARVSLLSFGQGGFTLLRGSVRILTRRADAFHNEIERASWWRFWVYAVFTAGIQMILLGITVWMIDARITAEFAPTGRVVNFAGGLVMLLLGIPFYVGTLAGGAGIGWLGMRMILKVKPPFLKHLYAVAIVWLPINLAFTVIGFVFNLLNLLPIWHYSLLAILSSIGLSVLAGFLMYDAVRHFEGDIMTDQKERRKRRLIGALNIGGIFAVRLLFGLILGAITSASVLIYLFA